MVVVVAQRSIANSSSVSNAITGEDLPTTTRSHAHLRFCLFISSTLALLIDTARFKLCACLVSRSRSLLFHQGEGGRKKRFARCWLDFHHGRSSSFLSFSLSLEAWNRTKSIGARFKGLRRKKIELLVDWKRFYYPCVFFYNTFCIGIFSRKKEIYLIVFKYISLYYSKKIEFLNSAKNLTLYRGIFAGSMEKDIFKKYFHRLKGLPFFFFFNFDSIHIWILYIFIKSYYFLF